VVRHLAVIVPACVILAVLLDIFLPTPLWVSVMMAALILSGSVFSVAFYADDIRAARLRQHGLPVPTDPDLGRPTH